MSSQQPVVVRIEQMKSGCGCGGCLTILAVALVIGFAIEYWYVAVAIAAIAAIAGVAIWLDRRQKQPGGTDISAKSRGELWASQGAPVVDLCGSCGAQMTGSFCASCGTPRPQRCSGCGTPVTSRFCPNCGTQAGE